MDYDNFDGSGSAYNDGEGDNELAGRGEGVVGKMVGMLGLYRPGRPPYQYGRTLTPRRA